MNIDELERLARAAHSESAPVYLSDQLKWQDFQDAANPAAILELIERVRELENSLIVTFSAVTDWADHGIGPDPELDSQMLQAKALINKEPK